MKGESFICPKPNNLLLSIDTIKEEVPQASTKVLLNECYFTKKRKKKKWSIPTISNPQKFHDVAEAKVQILGVAFEAMKFILACAHSRS